MQNKGKIKLNQRLNKRIINIYSIIFSEVALHVLLSGSASGSCLLFSLLSF